MRKVGIVAWLLFAGTVLFANWLVTHYGIVDVGFGLKAPAAVFVVGVAFTMRDVVHQILGRWWAAAAIVAGCIMSLLFSPQFAFASATGFLVSEFADLVVFDALRERFVLGVLASNAVGLVIDSVIFLSIAFGSLEFLKGQVVGKALMTLLALPFVWGARRALLPRHA